MKREFGEGRTSEERARGSEDVGQVGVFFVVWETEGEVERSGTWHDREEERYFGQLTLASRWFG